MGETMAMRLTSFQDLRRASKNAEVQAKTAFRIVIVGDCATQHIATAIRGFAAINRGELPSEIAVLDTDYDQIEAQLTDDSSELYQYKPQAVLLFCCVEKLYSAYTHTPEDQRCSFAQSTLQRFRRYRMALESHEGIRLIQPNFVDYNEQVFGNYAFHVESSFRYQLFQLQAMMAADFQNDANAYILDLQSIQARIGRERFFDSKLFYIAKMPLSHEALVLMAGEVIAIVRVMMGQVKKCVVMDLDNTIWGGVIGEDGLNGIRIGELGDGTAFNALQAWLLELKKRGILLAVCSKNDEAIAKEPFEKHPEMTLRLNDIAIFVANWEDKASNIRAIQQQLNIGMDSIVFLDDNPFERQAVRSLIPQVTVPELPEDPASYLDYLQALRLFETASFSQTDQDRTKQYQALLMTQCQQAQFASYDDYLKSLGMIATVAPFDAFHYPRIAQLSQRSNQFNLRTIRWSEKDVEQLALDPRFITMYFTLRDQYTDHGLIGMAVLEKQTDGSLTVVNWLMSCRVLKRGMEEFIVDQIVQTAIENGFHTIHAQYCPTPKNAMVKDIYARMGFERDQQENCFTLAVAQYQMHRIYIEKE